ncbi:hypothetical protein N3K63_12045 [Microbacterium sp. W1N]|uniref:hypothetical protein n=1 Tax=Microbacterium festucae TaxID=2977531 RepID=UPI0021C04379|nr:hypothetical protein [Microbacterium festucae]MCT9821010.1 hypothetical protein [Microbacterium festucae]
MDHALDAVLEIFSWIGFAGAAFFGALWLVLWAADGSWLPVQAIVDRDGEHPAVRWFGTDGAHHAFLAPHDAATLDGADEATVWHRVGRPEQVRLTRRPPALDAVGWGAVGLAALGVVTLIGSWVVLFVRG